MAADVTVVWNGSKLDDALLNVVRPAMADGLSRGLDRSARLWDRAMQQRMRRKGGNSTFGSPPGTIGRRTGSLARSLNFRVQRGFDKKLSSVRLVLFTAGVPYARVQEYGAVIRPRRAKHLTIPGKANLTAAGVARKGSARSWFREFERTGDVAVVPSKTHRGTLVVLWRKTRRSKWQHWWTLVKQVTIKGPKTTGDKSRLGFRDTWDSQQDERAALIQREVQAAINGLKRGIAVPKVEIV